MIIDGTSGITYPDATIETSAGNLGNVTAINGGQLAGLRNKLINGMFDVWQRSTSTSSVTGYVSADRWYSEGAGTVTTARSSTPTSPSNGYYFQYTTGAASSYINLGQAIETANVTRLRGQTVTVSFWMKTTGAAFTGSVTALVYYSNSTDAYASQTTGVSLISGSNLSPTSTWQRGTSTFVVPADANGLKIVLNHSSAQATGVITGFADIQLEVGTTATPLELIPVGLSFVLCQRYYQVVNGSQLSGQANGSTAIYVTASLPVALRTGITTSNIVLLKTSFSGGAFELMVGGNWITSSGNTITSQNAGNNAVFTGISGFTGLTAGQAATFNLPFTPVLGLNTEL